MGQQEVFDWLKLQREKGDESFFTAKQIYLGINEQGSEVSKDSVNKAILKLRLGGFLEYIRRIGWTDYKMRFRLKGKYV